MTPYEIDLFLHIATTPSKYEYSEADIYLNVTKGFMAAGIIEISINKDCVHGFSLTPKGHAYLKLLTSIPYPTVVFFDANNNEIK